MYSLFGYYYYPLAEYLKANTNIRKEKALTRGNSRRWVQKGAQPTGHQARQVSRSRLRSRKPCGSSPTPATAHQSNSSCFPCAECTGIVHRWRTPQGGLSMAALDVHIAHWLAGLLLSGIQIFNHLVGWSLFLPRWGSDQTDLYSSGDFLARTWFSYFCPTYVKCYSVLPKEIIVHLIIHSFKILNIWLVMCHFWKLDIRTGHWLPICWGCCVPLCSVLVSPAHHRHLQQQTLQGGSHVHLMYPLAGSLNQCCSKCKIMSPQWWLWSSSLKTELGIKDLLVFQLQFLSWDKTVFHVGFGTQHKAW